MGIFCLQGALSPTPNLTTLHIIPGVQGLKHQPFQKEGWEAGQGGIIVMGGYINGKHNVKLQTQRSKKYSMVVSKVNPKTIHKSCFMAKIVTESQALHISLQVFMVGIASVPCRPPPHLYSMEKWGKPDT